MSIDLIPLPTFEGRMIRAIEHFDQLWFPVSDLAAAWGIDRSTPDKIVERNIDVFLGFTALVKDTHDVTSNHAFRALNERGLYLMMGKISASRLKNPEAKRAIIRFQRWVPELIQKFRKGEIAQITDIKTELEQARHYAGLTQGDPRHFQAAVFKKHNMPEYAEALLLSPLASVQDGGGSWFNPSQLVQFCNDPMLTAERLNHYLCNNPKDPDRRPFQFKEGYIWRLTPLGREHGKEYIYTAPSQHQEIRIAWRKSVLVASGLVKE